jgi:hypothetical protein
VCVCSCSYGCLPGNKSAYIRSNNLTDEEFQENPIINWEAILWVNRDTLLWILQVILAIISLTQALLLAYLGYKVRFGLNGYSFLFHILFTVHLGTVRVNNQLDALFQCIYYFISLHISIKPSAHHQENQVYQYIIWYVSLCVGGRLVCRSGRNSLTYIPDGHLHRVTYTRCCIDTIDSPDDEHWVSRNM